MELFPGFNISIYLISIMIAAGGIVLGAGYALDDKKIKEMGRKELYESFFNAVLVAGLIVLFSNHGVANSLIDTITKNSNASYSCPEYVNQNSALCFAYNFLVGNNYSFMNSQYSSLSATILGMMAVLFVMNGTLVFLAAFKVSLPIISFTLAPIFSPFISELQYLIKILSGLEVGIYVQAFLLQFIALTAIPMLMPAGLVLRTFYPSRKVGGFLIALALSLYVVFPLTYLIDAKLSSTYNSLNTTELSDASNSANALADSVAKINPGNATKFSLFAPITNAAYSLSSTLNASFNQALHFIGGLIVETVLFPLFSITVTIISIKELSGIFGSEANLSKFDVF